MSGFARSREARKIEIIIMEIYGEITKFLKESGKCLLIEDGKLVGVVLTIEEYDRLKPETRNPKSETKIEELPTPKKIENKSIANPIGEAIAKEMDFPEVSANIDEINLADAGDVTLEDLGLDELPY